MMAQKHPTKRAVMGWIVLALLVALAVPALAAAAQPVTVKMIEFNRLEEIEWQRAVVERFNAERSDIQIELVSQAGSSLVNKMLTMLAAGDPLDIGYHDPNEINVWGRQGIAMDLQPYLDREPADSPFREFFPAAMDLHVVNGRRYGIPLDLQTQAWFYSETALDEAGLPYPGPDWTWQELADWGRQLSIDRNGDGTIDRWAMRFPQWYHWIAILWAYGAEVVDDAKYPTRFAGYTDEMQEALQFMANLVQTQVMAPPGLIGGQTADNIMRQQNIAMAIGNALYMQHAVRAEAETGLPWNVTRLPKGPTGQRPAILNALGWFIFREARNPDAAWEVIRYFSSAESMELSVRMRGTMVPHRTVTQEVWPYAYESPRDRHVFIEAIVEGSRGIPNLTGTGLTAWAQNTERIVRGDMPMTEGLEAMRLGIENWIREQQQGAVQ